MDIYLKDDSENKVLWIPVNPEEITVARDKRIDTIDLLGLGEVDFMPGGVKIRTIAFSSFFPSEYDPSYCKYDPYKADRTRPNALRDQIETWVNGRIPLRLIVTTTGINLLVIPSMFNPSYRGGEVGDVSYEIELRIYREVKVLTKGDPSSKKTPTRTDTGNRPDTKKVPKTYVVKQNDSLWSIAKLLLGSGSKWEQIYSYSTNAKTIGKDPNKLILGTKLVIPS